LWQRTATLMISAPLGISSWIVSGVYRAKVKLDSSEITWGSRPRLPMRSSCIKLPIKSTRYFFVKT
jgi:hypothetical protein